MDLWSPTIQQMELLTRCHVVRRFCPLTHVTSYIQQTLCGYCFLGRRLRDSGIQKRLSLHNLQWWSAISGRRSRARCVVLAGHQRGWDCRHPQQLSRWARHCLDQAELRNMGDAVRSTNLSLHRIFRFHFTAVHYSRAQLNGHSAAVVAMVFVADKGL